MFSGTPLWVSAPILDFTWPFRSQMTTHKFLSPNLQTFGFWLPQKSTTSQTQNVIFFFLSNSHLGACAAKWFSHATYPSLTALEQIALICSLAISLLKKSIPFVRGVRLWIGTCFPVCINQCFSPTCSSNCQRNAIENNEFNLSAGRGSTPLLQCTCGNADVGISSWREQEVQVMLETSCSYHKCKTLNWIVEKQC